MKTFTVGIVRLAAALSAATAFVLMLSVPEAGAAGLPKVDAGAYHTCAVAADGALTCWGDNSFGQMNTPAGTFTSVSSGFYHSCAVRTNGSVACWGWNAYGQTSAPAGTFTSVTAGYAHTCSVRADDVAVCWGGYGYGAFPPGGTFSDVASGNDFSCGVRTSGALACWGYNHPDGNAASPPLGTFTSVEIGMWHSCAVRTDASIACWGQRGNGESSPPPGSFASVTTGGAHSCGIRPDASLVCWGAAPGPVPTGSFHSVSSGYIHACAVKTTGTIVCWGNNGNGQTNVPVSDATPPLIGNSVSGTLGANGWYKGDVGLDWSVDEPESPDSLSTTGCVDASITADQAETAYSCSATSAGGSAGPVEVVIKRDATPPTVDCTSPAPVFVFGDEGALVTASVSDVTSGAAAGSVSAAADTATVGEKTVLLSGADNAGNEATATCSYVVIDPTAPAIASLVDGTVGANGWYTSVVGLAWSVTEPESPESLVLTGCLDRSITADQAATYSCSASSAGGSAGPVEVAIKRDATDPTIACAPLAPAFLLGQAGALVTASVSDATSGPAAASVSAVGNTATVGAKSASLTGSDNAGNETTAACGYRVGYAFDGFFQPVDNGMLNKANAGRAIPLKWRLSDASGSPVTDLPAASITTITLNCGTLTEGVDAIEEYASGASGLQNLGDGYYQINWKSPTTYAGTCKRLRLDLGEGTYRTADFRFVN